ncbi:MAG: DNA-binding transcriptional LysR family regulator [Chlamydiales bacterium]|jgi:DNA-binding transcriptional LysR family regulator
MIQLHRLEGFYWVARTEGYARAARAFPYPITQPAVHQQVKKLEGELGVALFERLGKDRMQLTAAGQRLYGFVRPFFEQLPSVVRSIDQGNYEGSLSIHTASLMLRHLLPAWIKRLKKRRPGLRITLVESLEPAIGALRDGDADLIVDYIPDPPADIATLRVGTLYPFIVVSQSHTSAKRKRLSLAALRDETFVSYTPGTPGHVLQMQALARHEIVPAQTLAASSAEAILGFVESGLGYSLVPSIDASGPKARGLRVDRLGPGRIEFPIVAAWRKDTPENPLLDAALETAPTV